MKFSKILVTAAAMVAVACGSAMAFPTGQIWIPSTDAKALKEVTLNISNYARFSSHTSGPNYLNIGAQVGLLPFEKIKMEVGVDYLTAGLNGTAADAHPFAFNAKVAVPEGALFGGMPALAAGIYNVGTFDHGYTGGNTMSNIAYGLIAKTIPMVGRISVGGYHGAEKNLGENSNIGLLASWDRAMPEISDKLWLAVDYMGGPNYYNALSVGGSWAFTSKVSLLTGVNFYNAFQDNHNSGGKPTFTTQLFVTLP